MPKITVLLTKYHDFFGTIVGMISGSSYSHASISVDEKETEFYSFNYKGFVREKPKKYCPSTRADKYLKIEMEVTPEAYESVKKEIEAFREASDELRYSKLGVILLFLHIPHKFRNRYFCSQFIAEILDKAGIATLKKKSSLYFPNQLVNEVEYRSVYSVSENLFSLEVA